LAGVIDWPSAGPLFGSSLYWRSCTIWLRVARWGLSASDLIRLHWAYLLGLMEVGTQPTGNHPGLLIFDEPQQQSVEENSFQEMLRHPLTHGAIRWARTCKSSPPGPDPVLGSETKFDPITSSRTTGLVR
jgi:hypothetical protein